MASKSLVPQQILVGNRILPAEQAALPVSDRGFLFGDAVYETLRTYHSIPFLIDEHLERLRRSADALYLHLPWSDEDLKERLERLLVANRISDGRVRITVTRGIGDVRARVEQMRKPNLVMTTEPLPEDMVTGPVSVEIASRVRNLPGALDPAIKSGNFLNNILARFEMKDPAAFEVLLPNQEGGATEGSLSNLFIVDGEGALLTPGSGSGLLPGITRELVMTIARAEGIAVRETSVRPEHLLRAAEAFLTASTIEILPIRAVDGHELAGVAPGEVTTLLHARYREAVAAYLSQSRK